MGEFSKISARLRKIFLDGEGQDLGGWRGRPWRGHLLKEAAPSKPPLRELFPLPPAFRTVAHMRTGCAIRRQQGNSHSGEVDGERQAENRNCYKSLLFDAVWPYVQNSRKATESVVFSDTGQSTMHDALLETQYHQMCRRFCFTKNGHPPFGACPILWYSKMICKSEQGGRRINNVHRNPKNLPAPKGAFPGTGSAQAAFHACLSKREPAPGKVLGGGRLKGRAPLSRGALPLRPFFGK